ncbi:hypothetical protein QBC47DRAFT_393890 [Echria macrotheca]|uniref:F-box domain-containing protein n=1 Tax=Echria macrotheca TaxID=438768 RepID=A0AAJ0B2V1_9PEZI|nr:hypothetical protein QBC47DRAFT_393890 [Echria macrotheca]
MADVGKTPSPNQSLGVNDDNTMDKMRAKLGEARKLAENHSYEAAMSTLLKTINLCACSPSSNKHPKDKSCNILQCIKAVNSPSIDALRIVTTGPCTCGTIWPACTAPLHAEAVDELAGCLEKAGKWEAALSVALGLVRLDFASAIGYCRVVKILRQLTKTNRTPDNKSGSSVPVNIRYAKLHSPEELWALVKCFIRAGLHNCQNYRQGPETKYDIILRKMAHSLSMMESRKDPIRKLPREILSMIFSYLDTTSLLRCQRVNKEWSQLLLSDRSAWTVVRVKEPRNPGRFFHTFLSNRPGIRTLVFEDLVNSRLEASELQVMLWNMLPNLERMHLGFRKLHDRSLRPIGDIRKRPRAIPVHLSLRGTKGNAVIPLSLREHLESLDYVDGSWLDRFQKRVPLTLDGMLPRLKRLRLTGHFMDLPIDKLALITPQLEHLYLDGHNITSNWPETTDEPSVMWPRLRSLFLGYDVSCHSRCYAPLFHSPLESIEFLCDRESVMSSFFTSRTATGEVLSPLYGDFPVHMHNYPRLRVFRARMPIHPALLENILAPAARNGTLEVLDISMGADGSQGIRQGFGHAPWIQPIPAQDLAYAATESLQTLGLRDFNWAPEGHFSEFDGEPFLDFLKLFPNVHTVAVYPGKYKGVSELLFKLICMDQIKVIYQDFLSGIEWDQAWALARKYGVEVKHANAWMPLPKWPDYRDW